MSLRLLAADWVLPITAPPIRSGAVVIDGELIVAVGSIDELCLRYPEAPVTALGKAAILPGFVNIHTHLELTVFRGRIEEPAFQRWILQLITLKAERLGPEDLLFSARLGCAEAIRAGITTVADTADAPATLSALIESGLRGIVYQECFGPDPVQAADSIATLRAKLDDHAALLARTGALGRLRVGISPHAPYSVSARLFESAARLAVDQQLDVAIHAAESLDEALLLRDGSGAFGESLRRRAIPFDPPGCSTVRYFERLGILDCAPLLIHGVAIGDPGEIELIHRRGLRLAHCPKSNAKLGHGIAPLRQWLDHAIPTGLGTDSVASNNSLDLIEEARFATLLHRAHHRTAEWPSASEMLRLMTIEGARALRLDHQVGSLEAGKRADVIAIDLSHTHNTPAYDPATAIIFAASARDLLLTIVNGRTLFDGRELLSLDQSHILDHCRRIEQQLA